MALPRAQDTAVLIPPGAPVESIAGWREAPEYVALFAPRLYREAYRAFVTGVDLESARRLVTADEAARGAAVPGAWRPRLEYPLDALGTAGTFDHGKVLRLYGSRRPSVARGPRGASGVVEESWTLISPYPSADLNQLNPGTLLLVLRVP
jgi:hypothetical protein